jgi:hypothetical protein
MAARVEGSIALGVAGHHSPEPKTDEIQLGMAICRPR